MKILFPTTLILMLITLAAPAQKLSRAEKAIMKTVSKNNDEAIKMLETVVNMNSGTMNQKGVKMVGQYFMKEFENIGFSAAWEEMPEEMNRAGHLVAETKGKKGKRVLLIGHLDTVFEEDSPFQEFKRINDSIAHGPGTNDMKGGDIIILYALKALYDNKLLSDSQIIVVMTGDEESSGKPLNISRKTLIDAARRSDVALAFENSTGFNDATITRRGSSLWKLDVKGVRAHSSEIFSENVGAGAIFEAARILNAFYNEVRGEDYLTFNPGIILGGTQTDLNVALSKGTAFGKDNVVAQSVTVNGGLRFISEEQKENARAKMRAIVSQNLPNTSAEISFIDSYPAMPPTPGNTRLLELFSQVSQDLGQGEVLAYDPMKRGAGDISFVAAYADCLDGLGSMGNDGHTLKESVNLKMMEPLTQRAAILIYRLINSN